MVNQVSNNGYLHVGMQKEKIAQKASGYANPEKASKKLTKAFDYADRNEDGVIQEKELQMYNEEMRKKNVRTGIMVAGGLLLAGVTAIAISKGKQLKYANNTIRNLSISVKDKTASIDKLVLASNHKEEKLIQIRNGMKKFAENNPMAAKELVGILEKERKVYVI